MPSSICLSNPKLWKHHHQWHAKSTGNFVTWTRWIWLLNINATQGLRHQDHQVRRGSCASHELRGSSCTCTQLQPYDWLFLRLFGGSPAPMNILSWSTTRWYSPIIWWLRFATWRIITGSYPSSNPRRSQPLGVSQKWAIYSPLVKKPGYAKGRNTGTWRCISIFAKPGAKICSVRNLSEAAPSEECIGKSHGL